MRTERAWNWPVAIQRRNDTVLIGIPQRLGDGSLPAPGDVERFQSLEAIAGSTWFEQTIALLLPRDRAWAWWLPSRSPALAALGCQSMPRRVMPKSLGAAVCRRWLLCGAALAVVPPGRTVLQDRVLEFAGFDTEQMPEFIWVIAHDDAKWDPKAMARWCRDRSAWQDPASLAATGAERIVAMFDGQLHCWLPAEHSLGLQQGLRDLARTWQVNIIEGPAGLAWPTEGAA